MMEIIIGHVVWCMLVDRSALAILDSIYGFIASAKHGVEKLPSDVRRELWQIRSLLPLIAADLARPWCSTVYASDASPFGLGVCARKIDPASVRAIGSVAEKWRFRIADCIGARRHALEADTIASTKRYEPRRGPLRLSGHL